MFVYITWRRETFSRLFGSVNIRKIFFGTYALAGDQSDFHISMFSDLPTLELRK
jgi:hypothetical protein